MESTSYKDLEVWKRAIRLAKDTYELTENFPQRELYRISEQLRRSVISVAANIAVGQARNSRKEFKYLLNISLGSLAELETLLTIAFEIAYIPESKLLEHLQATDEITRMLKGFMKHISE